MQAKSWISPKVELRKSRIHGNGLFAVESIEKDEVIAYKGGHLLEVDEFNKLSESCKAASLQIDNSVYLAPVNEAEVGGVMVGINHSCSPNVGIQGQIDTTAMRDIEPGEELTGDYVVAYQDDVFSFSCNCGSDGCREKVTSEDWKISELQRKYKGYFSLYLQRLIDKKDN